MLNENTSGAKKNSAMLFLFKLIESWFEFHFFSELSLKNTPKAIWKNKAGQRQDVVVHKLT